MNHSVGVDLQQASSWLFEEKYEHALDDCSTILDAEQSQLFAKVDLVTLGEDRKTRIGIPIRPQYDTARRIVFAQVSQALCRGIVVFVNQREKR